MPGKVRRPPAGHACASINPHSALRSASVSAGITRRNSLVSVIIKLQHFDNLYVGANRNGYRISTIWIAIGQPRLVPAAGCEVCGRRDVHRHRLQHERETIQITRTQGARVPGVYTIKDLGIVSTIFRAQRTWGAE